MAFDRTGKFTSELSIQRLCSENQNMQLHHMFYPWRSEKFQKEGAIISASSSSVFFLGRTKLKLIGKQEKF